VPTGCWHPRRGLPEVSGHHHSTAADAPLPPACGTARAPSGRRWLPR
jgi:hypothetical protein